MFPETVNAGPGRPIALEHDTPYKADVLSKDAVGITHSRLHRKVNTDSVRSTDPDEFREEDEPEIDEEHESEHRTFFYPSKERYLAEVRQSSSVGQGANTEDISKRTIRLGIYNNDSYRTVTKHLHDEEAGTKLASEDIYNSAGGQYEGDEIP